MRTPVSQRPARFGPLVDGGYNLRLPTMGGGSCLRDRLFLTAPLRRTEVQVFVHSKAREFPHRNPDSGFVDWEFSPPPSCLRQAFSSDSLFLVRC